MVGFIGFPSILLSFTEGNHLLPLLVLTSRVNNPFAAPLLVDFYHLVIMVEDTGIEPMTYCVQSSRSPN